MKILIVRTSSIGDVVQTLPAIEYLRRKFPDAVIDWVIEKRIASLLRGIGKPVINTVIEIDTKQWTQGRWMRDCLSLLRKQKYDLVFDLQGNIKSGIFTALSRGDEKIGFGWRSVREKPNVLATSKRFDFPMNLNVRDKYLRLVQTYFNDSEPFMSQGIAFDLTPTEQERLNTLLQHPLMRRHPVFMIAVGSRWKNKQLNEQTLLSLLKHVQKLGSSTLMFIFSNTEEHALAQRLVAYFPQDSLVIGDLSLPLWQSIMWHVDGIIAVDSAALHLAGTTQTPSFSVFGPTSASIFKPLEQRHYAYQGKCPYGRVFHKQCPILRSCPTASCIRDIPSNDLESACSEWLKNLF